MKNIKLITTKSDFTNIPNKSIVMFKLPAESVTDATNIINDIVEVSEGGAGVISEFTGIKEFTTNDELSVLNNYATIGALLSWNGSKYTVWNGDGTAWAYDSRVNVAGYYSFENGVDEYTAPSTQYGTVIAVCVGLGKWAATGWSGLTTTKSWCPSSNYSSHALYMYHPSMVHGTGKQNTAHVLENHDSVLVGTIWADIKSYTCGNGLKVFLPSKYELLECQENLCDGVHKADQNAEGTTSAEACSYNKQIAKLLSCSANDYYWSSSQYSNYYLNAFRVYFCYGGVSYCNKDINYRSLALLRF